MAEKSHASNSKPVLDKETMHMLDPWLKKEHKGSLAHRVAELFKHPSVLLVLDVLETTDHINDILEVIDIPMLMVHIDDHAKAGTFSRVKLYSILADRMGSLNTEARAAILAGIEIRGDHDNDVAFGVKMILALKGKELNDFLHIAESQEHSLSLFVYTRANTEQRMAILAHIAAEAKSLGSDIQRPLHIMSDVDDTFIHSGYGLGGPKFPKGTVMPGILQLFKATEAYVAFITARPQFIQARTFSSMRKKIGETKFTVLSGHLSDSVLIPFSPDTANRWIAARKYNNFCQFHDLFVGNKMVWFGDSGQADVDTGLQLMADPLRGHSVAAVFIQDVAESGGVTLKTPEEERAKLREQRVFICDNYIEVACLLFKLGLIRQDALKQVADAAMDELIGLEKDYEGHPERFVARKFEFENHARRAKELIAATDSESGYVDLL